MAIVLGNNQDALEHYETKKRLHASEAELMQMFEVNKTLSQNLNVTLEEFKRLHDLHIKAVELIKTLGGDANDVEYRIEKPKSATGFNFVMPSEFNMSKYTDEEIEQIEGLVRELLRANEELNAKIIAMDAYVKNTDKKNIQLQMIISQLKLQMNQL